MAWTLCRWTLRMSDMKFFVFPLTPFSTAPFPLEVEFSHYLNSAVIFFLDAQITPDQRDTILAIHSGCFFLHSHFRSKSFRKTFLYLTFSLFPEAKTGRAIYNSIFAKSMTPNIYVRHFSSRVLWG